MYILYCSIPLHNGGVRRMRQLGSRQLRMKQPFFGLPLENSLYSFILLQIFLRDHYEVGTKKWEIQDQFEVKTFFFLEITMILGEK